MCCDVVTASRKSSANAGLFALDMVINRLGDENVGKERTKQKPVEIICIEDLVPQNHLLRKIKRAVDFKKIYNFEEDLYCADNGRPSIGPDYSV